MTRRRYGIKWERTERGCGSHVILLLKGDELLTDYQPGSSDAYDHPRVNKELREMVRLANVGAATEGRR